MRRNVQIVEAEYRQISRNGQAEAGRRAIDGDGDLIVGGKDGCWPVRAAQKFA